MKVILTHEVSDHGAAGDVVDVKDGYARNFLFRRGLATAWTKGGQKQVDAIAKGRATRAVKSLEEAQSIKGNLESKSVTVPAHAGQGGGRGLQAFALAGRCKHLGQRRLARRIGKVGAAAGIQDGA